jgi:hypothetical protein
VRPILAAIVYPLIVGGLCLAVLPFMVLSFVCAGPVAGAGAVLLVVSQVWLFSPDIPGERWYHVAFLVVPIFGFVLLLQLIATHWSSVRWLLLWQLVLQRYGERIRCL